MNILIGLMNIFEKIINTPFTIKMVFNFIVIFGLSFISLLSFIMIFAFFSIIPLTYLNEFINSSREDKIESLKLLISNIIKSVFFFLISTILLYFYDIKSFNPIKDLVVQVSTIIGTKEVFSFYIISFVLLYYDKLRTVDKK